MLRVEINEGRLLAKSETQKSLTYDNFVAIAQRLTLSGFQAWAAVNERAVSRTEIFDVVVAILN